MQSQFSPVIAWIVPSVAISASACNSYYYCPFFVYPRPFIQSSRAVGVGEGRRVNEIKHLPPADCSSQFPHNWGIQASTKQLWPWNSIFSWPFAPIPGKKKQSTDSAKLIAKKVPFLCAFSLCRQCQCQVGINLQSKKWNFVLGTFGIFIRKVGCFVERKKASCFFHSNSTPIPSI